MLDVAQDRHCAINRVPILVVQFHLVPGAAREWAAHGATFGNVVTKKQTIFGYTLHVLVTLKGIIVDCILAPAHAADVVVGDKGFMSAPLATELGQHNRLQLLTIPRRNHYQSVLPVLARLLNAQRPDH